MKPISIKFQCFGPYKKETFVGFEVLEKNGLFLICGETGAGKTTILDAICYALYGKSSGGIRGDLSVMRCKLAEPSDETLVEFIFEAHGKRYLFMRSLRYGRKNLIDSHNCMVQEGEAFVPIFENPKIKNVNQKAEEIIGLSYEQFRQVIILPQGQFEKLLVSDSAEKEKILVSLFKAEKWQLLAEEMYRRIAEQDKELRGEIADIKSRLSDYQCETVEALHSKAEEQKNQLEQLKEQAQFAEEAEAQQKKVVESARQLQEQFVECQKRKDRVAEFAKKEITFQKMEAALRVAEKADAIKGEHDTFLRAKEAWEKTEKRMTDLQGKQSAGAANLAKVEAQKAKHEAGKPAYEEGVKRHVLLENTKALYSSLEVRKEQAVQAQKQYFTKQKEAEKEKSDYDKKHQLWMEKMEEQKVQIEAYTNAQNQYLAGISGTLAEQLTEGMPCPVCGSLEHPSPAVHGGEHVTEAELDAYHQRMQAAGKAVEQAAKSREVAEASYLEVQAREQDAKQNALAAQAAYEEVMRQKLEGIDTLEALNQQAAELKARIDKYTELSLKFQTYLVDAQGHMKAVEEAIKTAEVERKEAKKALQESEHIWKIALQKTGFATEAEFAQSLMKTAAKDAQKTELATYQAEFAAAKRELAEQEEMLAGKEMPNLAGEEQKLLVVAGQCKQTSREWILGQQTLEKMQKDLQNLSRRKQIHDERRIKVDGDLEFANRLRGRTGISLQRYVLGVMLSSITVEANRLLKNVHNGRYQLYRTDTIAGSGHKGGLELEVLDTQNNERRSVTTLSGGEKFLVALGLAIGLSTVVQAQGNGMRLGAMFIDEGFGSLDQNSIYDALEVLQGIQKANGLVGIISHVELLKDVIPSKIEVKKKKDGSELVVV